jgi:restriction endonuclease S subunit
MSSNQVYLAATRLIRSHASALYGTIALSQLGAWAPGAGIPRAIQGSRDGLIPVCKVGDMNTKGNERRINNTANYIDEDTAAEIGAKIHPRGTVIFPKIGGAIATNKRRILESPSCIDNNVLGITPNRETDSGWLYHLLRGYDFTVYQRGTSVPALRQGELEHLLVPSVPYEIQVLLGRFLDSIETSQSASATAGIEDLPAEFMETVRDIVWIDGLANRADEANSEAESAVKRLDNLLMSAFHEIIEGAPRHPMNDVAPLVRRQAKIDPAADYPELGVRCFGKGTFQKPSLSGLDVGTKKLYAIEPGDLVFSNVFAWEGAIAVAKDEDKGRFGSHRFITCVPNPGVATAVFLNFYFQTSEGIEQIRDASPGGAGRNRTLGLKKLEKIKVPVPRYELQIWFDQLYEKVETAKRTMTQAVEERNAILPSVLNQVFSGEEAT